MKKINQNLRKRIKNKSSDDQERNLNSATVLVTNLIGHENDPKSPDDLIEVSSRTEYLFNNEPKTKKRKEETF